MFMIALMGSTVMLVETPDSTTFAYAGAVVADIDGKIQKIADVVNGKWFVVPSMEYAHHLADIKAMECEHMLDELTTLGDGSNTPEYDNYCNQLSAWNKVKNTPTDELLHHIRNKCGHLR